ncbi:MAG TPA: choice-of-anchor J domain-containing protein [Polyangium sp.]|nr:choice-of-anchor J domain-containing protein [Polyangium sp.]
MSFMKKAFGWYTLGALLMIGDSASAQQLTENFADITTLQAAGWLQVNRSTVIGATNWFQGSTTVFPAQAGAPTSYIGANFNNTTGTNTISNWLLTPVVNITNGATMKFWTRTTDAQMFPDRLEVRLSIMGNSTDVGTTATSTGVFTTLLTTINPNLTTTGYPSVWTEFSVTATGLPAGNHTGRYAFRYFVTSGGPTGANSDFIGIDTVEVATVVLAVCGNNMVEAGETCDDGNTFNTDACTAMCQNAVCGDNIVRPGVEMCDDGNTTNGDGCDNNCKMTACRNGVVTTGEQCDDGNPTSGDGCDSNCTPTGCGNGVETTGEQCDDGNPTNGDGCDNNCKVTACGNGVVTTGEQCDDGNLTSGDGCDDNCTINYDQLLGGNTAPNWSTGWPTHPDDSLAIGDGCSQPTDCISGRCVNDGNSHQYCTRLCTDIAPCPAGWYCDSDNNGQSVCFEEYTRPEEDTDPNQDTTNDSSSCSVSASNSKPAPWYAGAILLGVAGFELRRCRRRTQGLPKLRS